MAFLFFKDLALKYAKQLIGGLIVLLLVFGGYFYWKHTVVTEALDERERELAIKTDEVKTKAKEAARDAETKTLARVNNALEIYTQHNEALTAAANAIPDRVFIPVKGSCSTSGVFKTSKAGPGVTSGDSGISKAELPAANKRELDHTISRIEQLQLKCERAINSME